MDIGLGGTATMVRYSILRQEGEKLLEGPDIMVYQSVGCLWVLISNIKESVFRDSISLYEVSTEEELCLLS